MYYYAILSQQYFTTYGGIIEIGALVPLPPPVVPAVPVKVGVAFSVVFRVPVNVWECEPLLDVVSEYAS